MVKNANNLTTRIARDWNRLSIIKNEVITLKYIKIFKNEIKLKANVFVYIKFSIIFRIPLGQTVRQILYNFLICAILCFTGSNREIFTKRW